MSAGRQYYHAQKRSDEKLLEYLYRLNVAGMRAKIQVRDGPLHTRREHAEHFIETLDDRILDKHLTLLNKKDADVLEDTLLKYERMQARQEKVAMCPTKFRQVKSAFLRD